MVERIRGIVRNVGVRGVASIARSRLWSTEVSCGLAADTTTLPDVRAAKIPVRMEQRDPDTFSGFRDELARVDGDDYIEVEQRTRMCDAGVRTLYVASDPDGRPIYAQWLVWPGLQEPLHRVTPRMFPHLADGETLVEGAYTFVDFRRQGAMADGMGQLLRAAGEGGARRCYTYVAFGNTPSLKGCANVGFDLDHVRVTTFRLGRRRVARRIPTPQDRAAWDAAVAPRAAATAG